MLNYLLCTSRRTTKSNIKYCPQGAYRLEEKINKSVHWNTMKIWVPVKSALLVSLLWHKPPKAMRISCVVGVSVALWCPMRAEGRGKKEHGKTKHVSPKFQPTYWCPPTHVHLPMSTYPCPPTHVPLRENVCRLSKSPAWSILSRKLNFNFKLWKDEANQLLAGEHADVLGEVYVERTWKPCPPHSFACALLLSCILEAGNHNFIIYVAGEAQ